MAPPPPSWWQRLVGWARAATARRAPVGDIGRSLAMGDTSLENLHARLGSLVESLPE
jgi:hypothetical protein